MPRFDSLAVLRDVALDLPEPDVAAAAAAASRQATLTKPPGSLGRLESAAIFLAGWQRRAIPVLGRVDILVFAANHGVVREGVSSYPPDVTGQMVANFRSGGAAIWQLARLGEARLRVLPLELDRPTADLAVAPAMSETEFLAAVSAGYDAVEPGTDLVLLGEMGIGNTTSAAALAASLFGGTGADWAGSGTGLDEAGIRRKASVIDRALDRLGGAPLADPLEAARQLGGRELAAILGATVAARRLSIPVLLDGFVSTVAAAPLARLAPDGIAHAMVSHRSAERGHARLLAHLGADPLLDLGMRLGEASGAAVALLVLRAALACHAGMATFAEAGVSGRNPVLEPGSSNQ